MIASGQGLNWIDGQGATLLYIQCRQTWESGASSQSIRQNQPILERIWKRGQTKQQDSISKSLCMGERSCPQNTIHWVTTFIGTIQDRQTHGDAMQTHAYHRLKKKLLLYNEYRVSLGMKRGFQNQTEVGLIACNSWSVLCYGCFTTKRESHKTQAEKV